MSFLNFMQYFIIPPGHSNGPQFQKYPKNSSFDCRRKRNFCSNSITCRQNKKVETAVDSAHTPWNLAHWYFCKPIGIIKNVSLSKLMTKQLNMTIWTVLSDMRTTTAHFLHFRFSFDVTDHFETLLHNLSFYTSAANIEIDEVDICR